MATNITSTTPPPRADWRRFAVAAVALVYAALAIGNGLDRASFTLSGAAQHVPAPFASGALEVSGEADLARDPHTALALAERLVARAPVEPSSTALLGAARAATGDRAGADRAFRVAGQLGWRIPLTQSYLEQAALDASDAQVAVLRLDALLRLDPQLLRDPATLAPFEEDAGFQSALLDRMATRPPWLAWYSGEADVVPAPILAGRLPTLLLLGDRGVVLGCDAIAPALHQLTGAGFTAQAEALRRRHCPAP